MDRKRILLIEDEPSHTVLYKYKLQTDGYRVEDIRSSDFSISDLKKEGLPLALIILSLELDNHQGYQYFDLIKEALPNLPILLLTTAPELSIDSGRAKFDYLIKPFSLEDFSSRVSKSIWMAH
ncbi:response regulator [Acinetobacter sp. CUI P1]|nr:response regulator [Acinetobacter sp. CUI P1]